MDESDHCVTACTRCPDLVESRSRIVNGVGPTDADLLVLGEAPGAQEDQVGEPFVGRSGQLLDDVLEDVGLDRENVRITNCVRCRPPDNRNPHVAELEHCKEWLYQEIAAIDPRAIVTVGKVPASHLLGRDVPVTAEAGSVDQIRIAGSAYPVVVCVHPAAVLYDRSQEERLRNAIGEAAAQVGIRPDGAEQPRLDDF